MRVQLDSKGRVYAMGASTIKTPQVVEQADATLNSPVEAAQNLRDSAQRLAIKRDKAQREAYAKQKARAKQAVEEEKIAVERMKNEKASHDQECCSDHMLHLAALQTMSGFAGDFDYGVSGHGLTSDGTPAQDRGEGFGRALQGDAWGSTYYGMNGFLDDLKSTVSSASSIAQSVLSPIQQAVSIIKSPSAEQIATAQAQAQAAALAQAQAIAAANGQTIVGGPGVSASGGIMSSKIGGIPVVALAGGAVLLVAILAMSMGRPRAASA